MDLSPNLLWSVASAVAALAGWFRSSSKLAEQRSATELAKAESASKSSNAIANAYANSRADLDEAKRLYLQSMAREHQCDKALEEERAQRLADQDRSNRALRALKDEFDSFRDAALMANSRPRFRDDYEVVITEEVDFEETPTQPGRPWALRSTQIDEPFKK